ncbi:MAG: hypothetical protein ACM3NQ_09850 [Bacteroidales bacterium]
MSTLRIGCALALSLAMAAGESAIAARSGQVQPATPSAAKAVAKAKKSPSEKMAEPWPDEAVLKARRADAEARRLFQAADALPVVLSADFKAVNADRRRNSTKTFPASLRVAGDNQTDLAIPVTLRTRGKLRLDPQVCAFPPLGVAFAKNQAAGPFEGQRTLKLITHCQDDADYDQFVLKEYLAYRLFNLVTPRSFRARLAKVTYVSAKDGKRLTTRYGVFVEDDEDLARRLDGRVIEFPHTAFKDYDAEALNTMMVFEYMIGNTDFSIWGLHNVKAVQTRYRPLFPITWDFDSTGLVSPPYAMPDPTLHLSGFRDRKYRGPCQTLQALDPTFQLFKSKQAESMALVDSLPDLRPVVREQARRFLADFYATLDSKDGLKKAFVDGCNPKNNTI